MECKIITITSGKGGVGKTTTTANIGTALAMQGKKTAVIDMDIGLRNLDASLGLESRVVYDIIDVIYGQCRLKQALIRDKHIQELYLLPAAQTREKNAITSSQMLDLCKELRKEFDFILIDSPAGIEQGFRNAIVGADEIIIVANPEMASVRDADRIIGLVEAAGKAQPRLIVNRLRSEMAKRGDAMDVQDVMEILGIPLLGIVPEDETLIIATNKGDVAVLNPYSKAGKAYTQTALRILGMNIPLFEEPSKTIFQKLRRFLAPSQDIIENRVIHS